MFSKFRLHLLEIVFFFDSIFKIKNVFSSYSEPIWILRNQYIQLVWSPLTINCSSIGSKLFCFSFCVAFLLEKTLHFYGHLEIYIESNLSLSLSLAHSYSPYPLSTHFHFYQLWNLTSIRIYFQIGFCCQWSVFL